MNIKTKLWLDNYIFGFLVRMLNLIVIPLGKILSIDHSLDQQFEKIAVCKFKGMGSVIQSTPMLKAIKDKHPNAKITYISTKENKAILQQIDEVDELLLLNDGNVFQLIKNIIPFWWNVFSRRFQIYIDLEVYSNFSSLITITSAAKNRLGFYLNSRNYRMGNYTHMMYYNTRSPIAETYMQFARLLKCENSDFALSELNARAIAKSPIQLPQQYILINPNASDLRIERRWPATHFANLCTAIQSDFPELGIAFVGSPGEKSYVDQLVKAIPDKKNIINLAGKTSILELINIIAGAALVVTNDTGPMHIAYAKGTKTLALFGPCAPGQYGQFKNTWVVYKNVYCSPCVHEFATPPCKGNNVCMKTISVEEVFQKFKMAMQGEKDESPSNQINYSTPDFIIGRFDRN